MAEINKYMMEILTPSIKDAQPVYSRKTAMKLLALNPYSLTDVRTGVAFLL